MTEMMEESVYRDKVCRLCSDSTHTVHHHHISSESVRGFAKQHMKKYLFSCIMCKQMESVVRPSTRKLILTTSTLYNLWSQNSFRPDIHMEVESIVGARIRDLTRALMLLYLGNPERLELILVAGLNNVGDGQSVPDIMEEIEELKQAVVAHSTLYNHSIARWCRSAWCFTHQNSVHWMSQTAFLNGNPLQVLKTGVQILRA